MPKSASTPSALALYDRACAAAADQIIETYSTSFGMATKLLSKRIRPHVRNIYALVRLADEIVDGAAAGAIANGGVMDPAVALDRLEADVYKALTEGFSSNPVVHVFAKTARETGFSRGIIQPFFESMRMDLWMQRHDQRSFEKYVYGSAEVVGLMCLAAFVMDREYSKKEKEELESSARALGAAFQKVNFLRDLATDYERLGRSYFPGVKVESFDEATKERLVADIDKDIQVAKSGLGMLPWSSRRAVGAALMLFDELNRSIKATPASELLGIRVRVSDLKKLGIISRAWMGWLPR